MGMICSPAGDINPTRPTTATASSSKHSISGRLVCVRHRAWGSQLCRAYCDLAGQCWFTTARYADPIDFVLPNYK